MEPIMETYYETEKEIKNEIYESTKEDKSIDYQKRMYLVIEEMTKKYPDWGKTNEKYSNRKEELENQESKCSEISSELYTHKSYFSQISEYKENIDSIIKK